jgi:hypothetical protein
MMQMKADQTDIERLYEVKINRVDFESMLDVQGVMSKQLKHIMVLMIEVIGCVQGKVSDTRQGQTKRLENLVNQVQSFTNWVMGFEPIDFMNAADASSMRPTNKLEEIGFKEYSTKVLGDFQPKKPSKRKSPRNIDHSNLLLSPKRLAPLSVTQSANFSEMPDGKFS